MAETRRRSSRLSAAENKTSAKAQRPEHTTDDESSSGDDDRDKDFDARKSHTLRKGGNVKSPQQQQKQRSPVQRAGQRRSPTAAQQKSKALPDAANGNHEAAENVEGHAAAVPDTAGPGPSGIAADALPLKPKPASRRGRAAAPLESLHNLTLWDIMTKHPASAQRAAKEWVDRYCQDKLEATSELMSMVVQAGGCDSGVSVDDLESGEMDDVIKRLVDTIVREGGTEPFRDKKLRNLRPAYEAFWAALASELHAAGHLLDDLVCDRLTNLLVGMSVTKIRGYRHVGTLTAGLLVTGWVRAQQQLAEAVSTARHQEEAAQKQKKVGADKKRVIESLKRQAETAQSQVRQLTSLLDTAFTSVFAVRFRDVGPEIRAVVIDMVGRWIGMLPATFMVHQYLKYVAWALSDRDAGVRVMAVSRLLDLLGGSPTAQPAGPGTRVEGSPAHLPLLHDFIGRFTGRFKELPYDIDEDVAVLGVQLLTRLVAVGVITDAQLPASDCYRLLVDNPPAIRRAAAELAAQLLQEDAAKLEARYAQRVKEAADAAAAAGAAAAAAAATTAKAGGSRRSGRSKAAAVAAPPASTAGGGNAAATASLLSDPEQRKKATMLGALLEMMSLLRTGQSSTRPAAGGTSAAVLTAPLEPELVEDLVDALYDRLPALRSWKLMADGLLDDLLAQVWGPMGLAHLAELLAAAVKRARNGASAAEKGGANARRQGARARALAADSEVLLEGSQSLLMALPRLLRRHQTDENVMSALVGLIRDLELELFSLRGDEAGWRALLGLVGEQLAMRGAAAELLTQCADTLMYAASSGPPALQPSAGVVLREVCDQLAAGLATAATVVRVMDEQDLADAVADLVTGDVGADVEELLALRVALLRAHAVLIRGGATLAGDPRVHDAVDELLAGCGSGRFLGPEVTGLLAETQLVVLLNNVHQMNTVPGAVAGPIAGGQGPSGSNTALAPPQSTTMQKLQQARDALVSHMVALHAAAAAQGNATLEPDEGGDRAGQARVPTTSANNVAVLQDMAFRVLSDVALVFGSKAWKGTAIEPVCLLTLSNQVADLMWRHCAEVLRAEDTRGSGEAEGEAEELEEENEDEELDRDDDDDGLDAGPRCASAAARKRARRRAAVASKMAAVGCLGRLLAHDVCGDYHRTIAIHLVAEFCSHGPEVAELIRDVCREMAASRPLGEMPQIYTGALRQCWASVTAAGDLGEDEEHEALQRFADLAKHIASMYAGHGMSRSELLHILRDLTAEALVDAPTNLAILAWGAASFVPKLAPPDAATLVGELESRLNGGRAAASAGPAELVHDRDDPDWAPLYHYLSLLKDKAARGRVAPRALKGPSATTPKAARNRKISFAPSPHERHNEEEEGGEEAQAAGPQAQPQAQPQVRKGGRTAAERGAEEGAWLHKAVHAIRKPTQHDHREDEEADEEEEAAGPRKQLPPGRLQLREGGDEQAGRQPQPAPPPPQQQQQRQQRGRLAAQAAVHKAAKAMDVVTEEAEEEGAGGKDTRQARTRTRSASRAGTGTRQRDVDVDAGPLNSQAHTQPQSQSLDPSAGRGPSWQPSLQALSDMGAEGAEGQEAMPSEDEEEHGRGGTYSGEPSDLRAITTSRMKTASDRSGEVDAHGSEHGEVEAHPEEEDDDALGDAEANAGDDDDEEEEEDDDDEGDGTAAMLPMEEELAQPARRTPGKRTPGAPARRAATAAAAPAPSVSRTLGATLSLAASDGEFGGDEQEEEGEDEEAGEGELGAEVSQGVPRGVNLAASESIGDGSREEGDEGEEGHEEEQEEEEEEQAMPVQRAPLSSRLKRRRLSEADSAATGGNEDEEAAANGGEGSDQLQPLPSISLNGQPQVSLRADSVVDTQGQAEPPRRRIKRRRH